MGFQMLMRVTGAISPYKEALQKLVEMPGETLILSTGYADYEILNNNPNFIDLVHKGLYDKNSQKKGTEIIILGGKFKHNHPFENKKYFVCDLNTKSKMQNCNLCGPYYCHQYKFQKFVNDMNLLLKNKKYTHKLRLFRASNDDFHGKIAMKLYKGTPIAAIVGSSNLTKPAFDHSYFFNHEADMFIWNGHALKNTSLQGFKGITIKDYTKDCLENIYARKLEKLINVEMSYLAEHLETTYNIDTGDIIRDLTNIEKKDLESYQKKLIIRLNILDSDQIISRYFSYLRYYKNLKTNFNQHLNTLSPLILNVNPERRTTQAVLLDMYEKYYEIQVKYSKEVNPINGVFNLV